MGWNGGELFKDIVQVVGHKITKEEYVQLIDLFEDQDCDTLDEVRGLNASLDCALEEKGYNIDEE